MGLSFRQIDMEVYLLSVMETLVLHLHVTWRDVRGHVTSSLQEEMLCYVCTEEEENFGVSIFYK